MAVPVPVPGTFHYLPTRDLSGRIQTGCRVLVPFGRRRVTGFVLGTAGAEGNGGPDGLELKEIIDLLGEEPLFGPDYVPFLRFVARYYHYPLGMVIAEALPAGLQVMSQVTLRLTEAGGLALRGGLSDEPVCEPRDLDFLSRLDRPGGMPLARISRDKGALSIMRKLETASLVKKETCIRRERVRSKTRKWISLKTKTEQGQGTAVRLGPRESELLGLLQDGSPLPLDELSGRFNRPAAMVRRLEIKGLIHVEEKIAYRDSLDRALDFDDRTPKPTPEQEVAIARLRAALEERAFRTFVLHGVTGSGKTEVYFAAARHALEQGRTTLFLVPEISLTPALEGLLTARFGEKAAVLHSGLPDGERYDQWLKIRRRKVRLVLGARSAIFAPLNDLGLIVVDEEHDGAYKQEDKLRYQARDLAVLRAQQCGAVVVLGSATPSLESYYAARCGRYELLSLTKRVGGGRLPEVKVVDMRYNSRRRQNLTPMLKQALGRTLEEGRQALLFINRRGLAGLPICLNCGETLKCLNCSVNMTLHQAGENRDGERLLCHYCGMEISPPRLCPACNSPLFRYLGMGTERLQKEVEKAFPEKKVARLDADTARPKGALTRILEGLRDRKLDVLVGTQMITKGHDFPNITLIGVMEADLGLHLPDFRAGERTFQLLAQVGGRAGRGEAPGLVIIQTLSPDHYVLLLAQKHDYLNFFEQELAFRHELGYPPFTRLVLARFQGNSEQKTGEFAEKAAEAGRDLIMAAPSPEVELFGAAPAPLAKVKGKYRFQILFKARRVRPLHDLLDRWLPLVRPMLKGQGVDVMVDVDPYGMM